MWLLHIDTESSDHYYAVADYELSVESTEAYIQNTFAEQIEDLELMDMNWRNYFHWEWVEVDIIYDEIEEDE